MAAVNRSAETNRTAIAAPISCAACEACCCRLEVLLMGDDAVPAGLSAADPWGGSVMRRRPDGWCAALDMNSMRCVIYERRPTVCRDYLVGGDECIGERAGYFARRTNPADGPA
jgi:Fe-S-cluster containining protein